MTQKCESCSAPADLFLCNRCIPDLRELLGSLVSCGTVTDKVQKSVIDPETGKPTGELQWVPRVRKQAGLLEHLRGYAVGQARRGEQVRRVHHEPSKLDGDSSLASHISAFASDDETNLEKARERREVTALNQALAAGGVNTAASNLLGEMHYSLESWAKGIATKHHIDLVWRTTTGFAHFLSQNVPKIALDPDAGLFHSRIRGFVRRTERIINPPVPPRECGPCPTETDSEKGRSRCATPLTADREAKTVTCPECSETYQVDDLIQRLWNDVDEWHLTRREILQVVEVLEQPLSVDTFKTWCTRGKKIGTPPVQVRLHPRGWRRPGETVGEWHAFREGAGDKPVYRLVDLRKFMTDRKPKTAASA